MIDIFLAFHWYPFTRKFNFENTSLFLYGFWSGSRGIVVVIGLRSISHLSGRV
jgi:hypothetical protein